MPQTPDYSLVDLPARAAHALEVHQELARQLEDAYLVRCRRRTVLGKPAIAILGMGRAGKDTAGEFLSARFGLAPCRSSSLNALPFVATMIGLPDDVAYRERHEHREFWINACNALRADDLTRLARWCLGACDLAVGLRGKGEFAAVMREGVCALSVWIENPRAPNDVTVEFTRGDCDVVVDNDTSLERFHDRLAKFGSVVYRR